MNGFLARTASAADAPREKRRYRRRRVNVMVEIDFPARGIRAASGARISVCNISEGGALLDPGSPASLPDCFYIRFPYSDERIDCYVINRGRRFVNARFGRDLSTAFVERIVGLSRSPVG